MSADYPNAEEHFVPDSFMFNSNAQKAIVIHETGGDATPQAVYDTFVNSSDHKSAHFAVGLDGSIWQYVPVSRGAGANGVVDNTMDPFWQPYVNQYGNLNTCTISVEHCTASPTSSTPLTDAQKQASFALVAYLAQKYNIAPDHVKPHHSICSTACPGAYPMDELIAFLQQGPVEEDTLAITIGSPYVANYFTETNPQHWQCTNGHSVQFGMLSYYKANNGFAALGLPLEDEQVIDGNGNTQQRYERGCLRYDPKHVYDNPPGSGMVYAAHVYRVVGQQIEVALQPLGGKA